MSSSGEHIIDRIVRRRRTVLAASVLVALAGGLAAATLPVKADFSALLPPSTRSVRDLAAMQERVSAFGTAFLIVEASEPGLRRQASEELRAAVSGIDRSLVARVTSDDGPLRRFGWRHRHLFVSLEDLGEARAALTERIAGAKLDANPLYIDLDDEAEAPTADGAPASTDRRLDDLRERLAEAEGRAKTPRPFVSRDGRLQLLIVQASFPASQVSRTRLLVAGIEDAIAAVERRHPGVRVGLTGDVATTLSEHRSILDGMILAAAVTIALVSLLLAFAYRSIPAILAILWALAVGTLATLGLARLFIGHLNIATAFLSAIVIGNGINPGLILMSRFRDELRRGDPDRAVARAVAGAARGTLTASLTAAVAYASLAITDFRGFRDFGVIGGVGMALCWLAAFTVLPAGLAELQARGRIRVPGPTGSSGRPARWWRAGRPGPRFAVVATALGLLGMVAAGWGAYTYLSGEPLERDFRKLRSDSADILEQRAWNDRISTDFEGGFNKNLSGRFAMMMPRRADVAPLVEQLRAQDRGRPPEAALLSEVRSLDDLLPDRQPEKLALLAEIRRLIDDDLMDETEGEDREELLRLRPPDDLRPLGDRDVPDELAWPFTERDGAVGRIVIASKSDRFNTWDVADLGAFSDEVREVRMPEGTLLGGQAFVFADMLRAMERDGPRATLLSLVGSIAVILLLLGPRGHGWVTILCTVAGTAGMIALAGLVGIKVNFLDFIALPITIGIGADYAANIAARDRSEPGVRLGAVVRSSGVAVTLCSLTTMIGYGSLLVSDNAGIRSFGLAAILGELTCLAAALVLCPALLALLRRHRRSSVVA